MEQNGVERASSSRLDRRAALKKAVVAGTIAWSGPTLVSSRASAVELIPGTTCTAKCAPSPNVIYDADVSLYCTENGQKWARIDFIVDPDPCGCGPAGTNTAIGVNVEPNPAQIKELSYDPATRTGFVIIGGQGSGALGNGSYTFSLAACFSCLDRSGDELRRFCTTGVFFTFAPGDGPCSSALNVGEASGLGIVCDTPDCAPCPATL